MAGTLPPRWRSLLLTAVAAALLLAAGSASAHFILNVNIRTIHVAHDAGGDGSGLRLLVRLPMPYLVADKLGPEQPDGTRKPAPFTTNRVEDGTLVHYLDAGQLRAAPEGLARILADGLILQAEGVPLAAEVGRLRAYPASLQPPFSTLEEVERALAGPVYAADYAESYVGDTVVDVELIYRTGAPVDSYSLRSTLDPGLPGQEETANLVLDHAAAEPLIFRVRGLMTEPVEVSRSVLLAMLSFGVEGVHHILGGLDHVLFVVCLVLGARSLRGLAWRITGFTIGHSITLSLGFLGYVPQTPWFIPLVETGIAASIIYAAVAAFRAEESRATILITALIGLLHGLGFSFVLQEILKLDSPTLWQSLLAFNLGVEAGQLAIAAILFPLLWLLGRFSPSRLPLARWGLALPCVAVAAVWVGERSAQLVGGL